LLATRSTDRVSVEIAVVVVVRAFITATAAISATDSR
jgi:hypothetical protein